MAEQVRDGRAKILVVVCRYTLMSALKIGRYILVDEMSFWGGLSFFGFGTIKRMFCR